MTLDYTKSDLKERLKIKLEYHFGITAETASYGQLFEASAMMVTEIMSVIKREFNRKLQKQDSKVVYYFSMEFLLGRSLKNNLFNLGILDAYENAIEELGFNAEKIYEEEPDAGLGNGGLGRLGACLLDSAASLCYPVNGYSILYEFGIFRQKLVDGWQAELPDFWLPGGEVWLIPRFDEACNVRFDGQVSEEWTDGGHSIIYKNCYNVSAVPHDMMISGFGGEAVCILRLWSAKKPTIDLDQFNQGNYLRAVEQSAMAEVISKMLYPSDNIPEGRNLRLRQQYFLISASIQDIVRKHLLKYNTLKNLCEKTAIHINETHSALAIPELMRILLDDLGLSWEDAWDTTTKTLAFTNHTIMSEALEVWPEGIIKARLPRIHQIIMEINERFCHQLWDYYPGDFKKISNMAIIAYGHIRMANLCLAACFSVNGVSMLHSEIIKKKLFCDFGQAFPEKFTNITNGISHRRWLCQANPELSSFIRELIGPSFIKDAQELERLKVFENSTGILYKLSEIKKHNKERLSNYLSRTCDVKIDPSSLYDVQVKRLHEYKRQTLKALHILYLYDKLRENPELDMRPQTFIFGAKAAPSYYMAKEIISLICAISREINNDKAIRDKLKIVFVEDYRVTLAELIMPAAEISEQISLAGMEASGTGNMKLMINGAVTIGTQDGANLELRNAVGEDNILIFGLSADEAESLRENCYNPANIYNNKKALANVIDHLNNGIGGITHRNIAASLIRGGNTPADRYMVLADFSDYCRVHEEALAWYSDFYRWNRMSLHNIASAGRFSADRALAEYASKVWRIKPVR